MSNHEAVAAAREAPIGDQRDLVAQSAPDQSAGRAEHLAHAGAAFGPFIADHDHIAGAHFAAQDGRGGSLLAVEDARRPAEGQALLAGDLGYRPFGSNIAIENNQMAVFLDRI